MEMKPGETKIDGYTGFRQGMFYNLNFNVCTFIHSSFQGCTTSMHLRDHTFEWYARYDIVLKCKCVIDDGIGYANLDK